jgi:hypothetical protein
MSCSECQNKTLQIQSFEYGNMYKDKMYGMSYIWIFIYRKKIGFKQNFLTYFLTSKDSNSFLFLQKYCWTQPSLKSEMHNLYTVT